MRLNLEPCRAQGPLPQSPYHQWIVESGVVTLSFYRTDGGYLLRFPHRADFIVNLESSDVTCFPCDGASENVIDGLYYNQVLPLLGSHHGKLVLHGSAVAVSEAAVAFVGSSGQGKSTLAAAFARAGNPFLTDDGVWIERSGPTFIANPNRPALRLWRDSQLALLHDAQGSSAEQEEKQLLSTGPALPFQVHPLPLRAIYLLGSDETSSVAIKPLAALPAIPLLISHAFILDFDDERRHREHFHALTQLADAVNCYRIDYPRSYSGLPEVIAAVTDHATGAVATGNKGIA
ncbi:hypothetical protein H9L13_06420 [Sphingomonas lutea]|uniref:Serine kinase n=1 Tax=Sphingomonas lutea TaxID=1045317 RepID=A0A7G9SEU2_9SPHN|nr:hypothetical protein [Sphingomonas lutea]QNN66367.1 hypothetical protein H9L13_06420 [Sphingomonas lutea]